MPQGQSGKRGMECERIRRMPHTGNTMSPLLWKPESWPSRLEELEARTGDLKEVPLRRDVRSLGMLLGEVLREQAGERLFHLEEDLRQLSIERREAATTGDATRAAQLLKQQMDAGRRTWISRMLTS